MSSVNRAACKCVLSSAISWQFALFPEAVRSSLSLPVYAQGYTFMILWVGLENRTYDSWKSLTVKARLLNTYHVRVFLINLPIGETSYPG
jgi:hypothetical protein